MVFFDTSATFIFGDLIFKNIRNLEEKKSLLSNEVATQWQRSNVENLTQNSFFRAFEGQSSFWIGCFADGNLAADPSDLQG